MACTRWEGACPSSPAAPQPCRPVRLCHRYTGTTPSPPPGSHYTSPSENMWNTGSTYNLSSGMAVAGEQARVWVGQVPVSLPGHTCRCFLSKRWQFWPLESLPRTLSPAPDMSLPGTGMPTAYDLSSVIAGGSSVGHNNLIPLGERTGGGRAGASSGLRPHPLFFFPGAEVPRAVPLCLALPAPRPHSPHPSVSTHYAGHVGRAGWGR